MQCEQLGVFQQGILSVSALVQLKLFILQTKDDGNLEKIPN